MLAYFFFFYFIKIYFPVHFLFKWRQNLSARPRISEWTRGTSFSLLTRPRARQSRVRIPAEASDMSCLQYIQTVSGVHPAPYSMGTGGSFSGRKAAGGLRLITYPPGSCSRYEWVELYLHFPCTSLWRA